MYSCAYDSEALLLGSQEPNGVVRRVDHITNPQFPGQQIRELPAFRGRDPNILFASSPISDAVLLVTKSGSITYVDCNPMNPTWKPHQMHEGSRQGRYRCIKMSVSGRRAVAIHQGGEIAILDFPFEVPRSV